MKKYRILFCKWNSICEEGITNGFQQLDQKVEVDFFIRNFESVDYDTGYLKELSAQLMQYHYDCVFSVNFMPIISRVCNVMKIIYISWVVDSPCLQLFSNSIYYAWNRIFLFDKSQYGKFHPLNPGCIFHMPLACDNKTMDRYILTNDDRERYSADVSFIGSTYEEKCYYNRIRDLPDYIKGYVDGVIQAQLNVYGYNFIEDSLTEEFCNEFKKYANWNPFEEDYTEDVQSIIADLYIGEKCTEQERLLTLNNISKNVQLDFYTLSDVSKLPNVHYKGGADSVTMMPKIFKCSKINLNMTSRPIKTGIPLRVFDILGAGGFLLTNYQQEIQDYFEIGKDLAVYESQEHLLELIDYYLEKDDLRIQIAENGCEKVRQYHNYRIRLEHILGLAFKTDL